MSVSPGAYDAVGPLTLTKLGHSCIRLERGDARLVLDPGAFSPPGVFDLTRGVLVTHQHADHLDVARLRAAMESDPDLSVWAPADVVDILGGARNEVHVVRPGDRFDAVGFGVEVVGEWHALIHPDIPRIPNAGYVIDGVVLHPGDALTVPDAPVDTLLLPVSAPWLKLGELIDYVRAVRPRQVLPIHDAGATAFGVGLVARQLGPQGVGVGSTEYVPWVDGDEVALA